MEKRSYESIKANRRKSRVKAEKARKNVEVQVERKEELEESKEVEIIWSEEEEMLELLLAEAYLEPVGHQQEKNVPWLEKEGGGKVGDLVDWLLEEGEIAEGKEAELKVGEEFCVDLEVVESAMKMVCVEVGLEEIRGWQGKEGDEE